LGRAFGADDAGLKGFWQRGPKDRDCFIASKRLAIQPEVTYLLIQLQSSGRIWQDQLAE
jgi:hypothetical protein